MLSLLHKFSFIIYMIETQTKCRSLFPSHYIGRSHDSLHSFFSCSFYHGFSLGRWRSRRPTDPPSHSRFISRLATPLHLVFISPKLPEELSRSPRAPRAPHESPSITLARLRVSDDEDSPPPRVQSSSRSQGPLAKVWLNYHKYYTTEENFFFLLFGSATIASTFPFINDIL